MSYFIKQNQVYAMPSSHYDGSELYELDAPEVQAILNPTPTPEQVARNNRDDALTLRYNSVYADIEYQGESYQMGQGKDGIYGYTQFEKVAIAGAIDEAKRDEVQNWITADNNTVPLTFADCAAILNAYYSREQEIFESHGAWKQTDMMQPWVYPEPLEAVEMPVIEEGEEDGE